MDRKVLQHLMDDMDRRGVWAFTVPRLGIVLGEKGDALRTTISRHAKGGLIQRVSRNVYVNPRAMSMPAEPLLALASFLRPFDFCYLSLESVLSDAGWISQIPFRYTMMTTGRSFTFDTPYGVLEMTHTQSKAPPQTDFDPRRSIHVASPEQAYRDLKRVRRNLDLVDIHEHAEAS